MTVNMVYDVRLNIEEYRALNEIVELRHYLLSYGQEMILMLTEDNLNNITDQLEEYLYNENSIRGSEEYRQLSDICYELQAITFNM